MATADIKHWQTLTFRDADRMTDWLRAIGFPEHTSACYLVVEDPDSVFDAAVSAGASVVREMRDEDYGGRGGTVRDPEDNLWSFGDYQPG